MIGLKGLRLTWAPGRPRCPLPGWAGAERSNEATLVAKRDVSRWQRRAPGRLSRAGRCLGSGRWPGAKRDSG